MRRLSERLVLRLPEVALALAGLIAIVRITGADASLAAALAPLLPFDPASIDPLDALTAGLALSTMALAVRRRKRLAWPMAVALFAAAAVAQAMVLRHPLGAALALSCLGILLVDVRRYRVGTDRRLRLLALGIMAVGVGVLVGGSVLADAAAPIGSAFDTLARWSIEILAFIDPTGLVTSAQSSSVLEVIEFATETAVLVAALAVLTADPDRPPPELLERDRRVARLYAHGALAPYQVGPDVLLFADHEGDGVVAYGRAGRTAVVLGDPIGPPPAAWGAFRAFEERCARGDIDVGVYQASPAVADHLRELGYRIFRVGEEAVIDVRRFSLAGGRMANLRHTVTRASRGGVRIGWYPDGLAPDDHDRWSGELLAVSRAWQATHGPAMRFTISPLDPVDLLRVGLAMATDPGGRIVAFATFRRTASDAWVLDVTRRRTDAVPGALEACLVTAATAMREAGDAELSLGLVALAGMSPAGDGPIEERLLAVGRRLVRPLYDIDGLLFFKGKFDPDWRPRFGAYRGRGPMVGYAVALLRLHLGLGAAMAPQGATGPDGPGTADHSLGRLRPRATS